MHAKGSNIGNTCRQIPGNSSSFDPNLPLQRGFDLSCQYNRRNQVRSFSDWRKDPGISHCRNFIRNIISKISYDQEKASVIANTLENWLFIDAASQEEYMNQDTFMQRLETQLNKLHVTKCSPQVDSFTTYASKMVPSFGLFHAWSNGSVLEPAFQKVAGPIINATDYSAVTVENKYGFPKGGLSHPSIVHKPVLSPDNCSSITTCTNMDVLPNFSASGWGSNLEASSKSICPYQQWADNWKMDLIKYGDCSGAMQKNDSMAFITTMGKSLQSESSNFLASQHVSREFSEVSNLFPGLSGLGDIRQYQQRKLEFQQNLEHFMQPYVLHGKTHMAQTSSCFVNQGEHSGQMLGQKTLKQPQPFTRSLNGDKQFTSESSADLFGLDGSANMNSRSSSKVSFAQMILLEYYYYKDLNIVSRDYVIKYLHSTVCCKGICTCEQYRKLLLHFDDCQSDACRICYSWKLRVADILERHLEFPNNLIKGSVVRKRDAPSANSEAMLSTAKRQKMESAFGVSLINNASSDMLTHKMVQPCSTGALSELKQQPESPLSPIYSEVIQCNVEQCTNPKLDSISNSAIKNNVIYDTIGKTFKNETILSKGLEADYVSEEPDPKSHDVKASSNLEEIVIRPNSNTHTLCKEPMHTDIEEPDPKSYDVKASSNLEETVIRSNSIVHTLCKEPKPADIKEPDPKSHDVKANGSLEETVIRSNYNMHTLYKEPMPVDIEEPDPKSHDVKASSNLEETVISSDYNIHTLYKEPMPADIEEPDPKSHDVKASSNLEETVIRSNYNMHTLYKESMPADIEEPDLKSHDVKASSNLEETITISVSNMHALCKEPMPADIEEPDPKSHDVKASSNLEETITISVSNVHGLCKEPVPADIEEPDPKSHDVKASSNLEETTIISVSNKHALCQEPMPADIADIQGRTEFNQDGINATEKVIEPKADQEKETKSPNPTVNTVSLTDFFTSNQITEHITSLTKQFIQSTTDEEPGIDVYKCQLCETGTLSFAPVPIHCLRCANRIKRNTYYYYRREEDDTQQFFCTTCYRTARGGNITFNERSVSKTDLHKKTNNGVCEEAWVECNKCKSWQHQICALYNDKRDLDYSAEYTCPVCRLKEIKNGMHVPLPKTAMFGSKDLPRTMLSDHIERRLFKRLMQESEDWAKVKGNKNLDEVLVAENLSVRVVLSVDKQLKVKKLFRDIFEEENYPAEFSYTSKVILLFQQIEGVDVCLFAMYVQEFGSECGYPNQRCVYISYLDSVKYFRPERATMSGEALRTFVYHEILIGYLDFCKKRGFITCYIWACPPIKGEDYILYCHPDTQKTPKNDKLRHWYHSMLRKAAEENIVVGLTNIYDHFFVPTGNCDSKVTAARLPYFDGDYWSGAAMDEAWKIEKETGGEYEKMCKKLGPKRTLKSMGHVNPSKETVKDIIVMQKLGQTILPVKEDFIVVQLQYVCMHCREVIETGKRWFCTECKKFQECERCHTADSHTSDKGEKHRLCQVLMNDNILCGDTKENDIILDNGLFDTRHDFLSYCQKNRFQFDSLRRAKYSSMMILYLVRNPTLLTVGTICRVCCKHNIYQCYWKCENCLEFTVCSACYNERGANCHAHTLTQTYSTAICSSGNLMQELQDVIKHASQCHSTKTQPCTYRHCLQIKKLFSHASRCTIRVSGGCQYCKKVWMGLSIHSRTCRDSGCLIPRCMDLKKQAEWIATQSEERRRAALLESSRASTLSSLEQPLSIHIEQD